MLVSDFNYELPPDQIAHYPLAKRNASRMLTYNRISDTITHSHFSDFIDLVAPGDLVVLNNTLVIAARLLGTKVTGGKIELLVEKILSNQTILAQIKATRSLKTGTELVFNKNYYAVIQNRVGEFYQVKFFATDSVLAILNEIGHTPIPPYLHRSDTEQDRARYQTVYAAKPGAVAAPTAGLHIDEQLLMQLQKKGVNLGYMTLHVGAGTYQPIRVKELQDHTMHAEYLQIEASLVEQIHHTKALGKRVIAIGTTTLRGLETASLTGRTRPFTGETNIFIYPGFQFQCVDVLLTNFHLPESTLLMLVCAFAGYEKMIQLYKLAVKQKYRFFSYGDCMLLT